jgi:hypothetical protein
VDYHSAGARIITLLRRTHPQLSLDGLYQVTIYKSSLLLAVSGGPCSVAIASVRQDDSHVRLR